MWRAGYSQSLRVPKEIAARLCSNKTPGPPSLVSSQLISLQSKAEKQKRKRAREKVIQSKQQAVSGNLSIYNLTMVIGSGGM